MKRRLIVYSNVGNYIGSWKCFAVITGDSCYSTLIAQNINEYELLSRNNHQLVIEQQQQQAPLRDEDAWLPILNLVEEQVYYLIFFVEN